MTTAPIYVAKDVIPGVDEVLAAALAPAPSALPMRGSVSGMPDVNLVDLENPPRSGFRFDVDLQAGTISNAALWGYGNRVTQGPGYDVRFNLTGGNGTVRGGNFSVGGLAGTHTDISPGRSNTVNVTGSMGGTVQRTGTNGLNVTSGTFTYSGGGVRQSGTLSGGGALR